MRIFILLSGFILSGILVAQPYVSGGKTRHRFAQLTLGADQRCFFPAASGTALLKPGPYAESRLMIGGIHFWGHADFYIAVPLAGFGVGGFSTGAETGFRYFPLAIRSGKIRPFAGLAFLPFVFRHGTGAALSRITYPLNAGLEYHHKKHLFGLLAGYNAANRFMYYTGRTIRAELRTPAFYVGLSYKLMLETTIGSERGWQSGRSQQFADTLGKRGRLNGFSMAIGPSSAFFLKRSAHTAALAPFADDHRVAVVFPDLGLGYYWYKPDLHLNWAYRNIRSVIEAHGYRQRVRRIAHTLELFKFGGDYHGFVPFAGLSLSYEFLRVLEENEGLEWHGSKKMLRPGVTLGWDIRPDRLQTWYLRTNVRYFPLLDLEAPKGKISLDQLEINFIQLVIYPQRFFR